MMLGLHPGGEEEAISSSSYARKSLTRSYETSLECSPSADHHNLEEELVYAAHADYYILLRVCARVVESDCRKSNLD